MVLPTEHSGLSGGGTGMRQYFVHLTVIELYKRQRNRREAKCCGWNQQYGEISYISRRQRRINIPE